MSALAQIAPTTKPRLMDLAKAAGVDVSDWANCKGGERRAAANPKYCYEWSFVEPGKVIVLNIWHHAMEEDAGGVITRDLNMRAFAAERPEPERTRALKMDDAIKTAIKDKLPVRVVVVAGKRRGDADGPVSGPSKVKKRMLDPEMWGIESYDDGTGECTLRRSFYRQAVVTTARVPDVDADAVSALEGKKRWVQHFQRERDRKLVDAKKRQVLTKQGKLICEACKFDFTEFYAPHAANFCEVHHRKALADLREGEETKLHDLAILCSNCHRVIHLIKPMPQVEQFRAMLKRS
jgi:5-methylcytosine-specific restriction protein A